MGVMPFLKVLSLCPMFSHFGTMPACDGRTDRHDNSASIASRGKNGAAVVSMTVHFLRPKIGKFAIHSATNAKITENSWSQL